MRNKKRILKIGIFVPVSLLILLALSSPLVAATPTFETDAYTEVSDEGPSVDAAGSDTELEYSTGPTMVAFECYLHFYDTTTWGSVPSSVHEAIFGAQQVEPSVGEAYTETTGEIYLNNGGSHVPGLAAITINRWYKTGDTYEYLVWLEVYCEDIETSQSAYYNFTWDVTVEA